MGTKTKPLTPDREYYLIQENVTVLASVAIAQKLMAELRCGDKTLNEHFMDRGQAFLQSILPDRMSTLRFIPDGGPTEEGRWLYATSELLEHERFSSGRTMYRVTIYRVDVTSMTPDNRPRRT
jgi:hypothetical protein